MTAPYHCEARLEHMEARIVSWLRLYSYHLPHSSDTVIAMFLKDFLSVSVTIIPGFRYTTEA